jgi:hypothetical protein
MCCSEVKLREKNAKRLLSCELTADGPPSQPYNPRIAVDGPEPNPARLPTVRVSSNGKKKICSSVDGSPETLL